MKTSALEEAQFYSRLGYAHAMNGQLREAHELYRKSLATHETAEAYTRMGFVYNLSGDYDTAIELCKRAIILDPDYGNPYNDIGAYLIYQGRYDEAVPWLELAIGASRYVERHFPYYNLGRIYERVGQYREAIQNFRECVRLAPDHRNAVVALDHLLAWMN
jgi:tetratricopeptide (TPR) repeat protein